MLNTTGQSNTVARAGVVYLLSNPLSLKHATWLAEGFKRLACIAEASVQPSTTPRGNAKLQSEGPLFRVRYAFVPGYGDQDARQAYRQHELQKAATEGGAFAWSRQMSLDRNVQRAECRNPGTGVVYYITRRSVAGELVFACTCTRFAMSKLPCKHILDAQIRGRFEALGYPELPSSSHKEFQS